MDKNTSKMIKSAKITLLDCQGSQLIICQLFANKNTLAKNRTMTEKKAQTLHNSVENK